MPLGATTVRSIGVASTMTLSRIFGLLSLATLLLPTGCADRRARAKLILRLDDQQASYAELGFHRAATFAANEHTVLATVAALPRGRLERSRPHESFRAASRVVVAASTAKPVRGELLLLGGTSVVRFQVTSLTLIPVEYGEYELRILAGDGLRGVDLTIRGLPGRVDGVRAMVERRCRAAQVPLSIPGRDEQAIAD